MKIHKITALAAVVGCLLLAAPRANGHDTWLQTNAALVRPGDAVYVDFLLGNHGNDHRDFKVAGKPSLESSVVEVVGPDGQHLDLKPSLEDLGYAPKEGYFEARFEPVKPGIYLVVQTSEQVAAYAPERIVRSAKTLFLVSPSLDKPPADAPGFDRPLGHALEFVPQANPIAPAGPGVPIKVLLLYKGRPLADARVSFVPRNQTLAPGFDPTFERKTDAHGVASFEPKEAGRYLVVAHRDEPDEKGKGYDSTKYAATLCVLVPAICPCCGE